MLFGNLANWLKRNTITRRLRASWWCFKRSAVGVFFKRVTGVGYKPYAPLVEDPKVAESSRKLGESSDRLVHELSQLNRELRSIGLGVRIRREPAD